MSWGYPYPPMMPFGYPYGMPYTYPHEMGYMPDYPTARPPKASSQKK
jgi:hypothetical protein